MSCLLIPWVQYPIATNPYLAGVPEAALVDLPQAAHAQEEKTPEHQFRGVGRVEVFLRMRYTTLKDLQEFLHRPE